jgi:hypothetical protein
MGFDQLHYGVGLVVEPAQISKGMEARRFHSSLFSALMAQIRAHPSSGQPTINAGQRLDDVIAPGKIGKKLLSFLRFPAGNHQEDGDQEQRQRDELEEGPDHYRNRNRKPEFCPGSCRILSHRLTPRILDGSEGHDPVFSRALVLFVGRSLGANILNHALIACPNPSLRYVRHHLKSFERATHQRESKLLWTLGL